MKKYKLYIEWVTSTWFGLLCQQKYCAEWDKELNDLLDKGDKITKGPFIIIIDGCEVWIGNRFYAYGHGWTGVVDRDRRRPKVSTMIRLAMLEDELNKQ